MEIPERCPLVYVSFSAEINPSTTESLIAVMANCANAQVKKVYLLLSTPGGSVMNGMNLYNVLKGMPFELTIHNVGNVDSIGNVVFLAGKERYSTSSATFMFHGVGFDIPPNKRLEEKDCRERLVGILSDQIRMGNPNIPSSQRRKSLNPSKRLTRETPSLLLTKGLFTKSEMSKLLWAVP